MLGNLFYNLSPAVRKLLTINGVVFIGTWLFDGLQPYLAVYYPASPHFHVWQLLTHMFMHADIWHLVFNMFALMVFGTRVEYLWGSQRFYRYYLYCGLGALLVYLTAQTGQLLYIFYQNHIPFGYFWDFVKITRTGDLSAMQDLASNIDPDTLRFIAQSWSKTMLTPMLGASGAVYGILVAFAVYYPNEQLMLLFPPMPIRAKWLVTGLVVISIVSGLKNNPSDNTAHFAHLGGILVGYLILQYWFYKRNKNRRHY
jgi:membrane associated rhomboid family serine protease